MPNLVNYLALTFLGLAAILLFWAWRQRRRESPYATWFLLGVLHSALGIAILAYPTQALQLFVYTIGAWALGIGLALLIMAFRQKAYKIISIINGGISIFFGVLILFVSLHEDTLSNLIGIYSPILGVFLIYLSVKLGQTKRHEEEAPVEQFES